jgi:lipoate synthase
MPYTRKPDWLKSRVSVAEAVQMKNMLRAFSLHTVCEARSARTWASVFVSER